jgi:FkbM family methyltransferase
LHDTNDFWFHLYKPAKGDTIVDVGAGRGEDLIDFSEAVGPTGRVIAIEANPSSLWVMYELCRDHNLQNVVIINYAAMGYSGAAFVEQGNDPLNNRVLRDPCDEPCQLVWGETLDNIMSSLKVEQIDLLKMNIEGGEVDTLGGAVRALEMAKFAVIACHDFRADHGEAELFRTREPVTKILTAAGFSVVERKDDARDYVRDHIHARR